MSTISLKNVSKSFKDHEIIKNINLNIKKNACTVLVGPSGCGKSTILRLICGLEDPNSGDIFIGGEHVNDIPPSKRGIAMVFQSYALYPHMTVFENMAFALKVARYNNKEIEERVLQAAKTLKIERLLDRQPKQLSGGQRQRVAIGRAIVRHPKAFLFDEPLSNLDAALRFQMRYELAKLKSQLQTTMVYVTHDQGEAMTLADELVIIKEGQIEQIGTPLELYNDPANLFVAGFIGSPTMNFLKVTLENIEDGNIAEVKLKTGEIIKIPISNEKHNIEIGDELTLGIRPEDIQESSDTDTNSISTSVSLVENLGGEAYVYVTLKDGTPINVRVPGSRCYTNAQLILVALNSDKCHLFDSSGKVIKRSEKITALWKCKK